MIHTHVQDSSLQQATWCPVFQGSGGKAVTEEGFTSPGIVYQGPPLTADFGGQLCIPSPDDSLANPTLLTDF